jgi:hypothetical protein
MIGGHSRCATPRAGFGEKEILCLQRRHGEFEKSPVRQGGRASEIFGLIRQKRSLQ